ncbi:potassium/sodium hyperpolarization-activated cyclic nucleotide-gated channel 1-like [Pieris napi]|uniref:potassium/sodium hyperpolarization-activated cyclic nucleotide-gated channel 1-like n=1 Tax=Pieris napi TaxID=78633 RepID=UPI001FBBFBB0|nr:potassium/sodium hyperpolarization-activated cyclic nucleotide-gated channel 1-like [Pieris napi]
MRFNLGKFHIDREYLGVGITLCILGIMFWYVMCYSLTLLVLNFRGNTIFQHGVSQLRRFLQAERVDKKLIEKALTHFRYWWFRTKGMNMQSLMNERIGVVFRQELNYYFFKRTIEATDTLLHGGESLQRQLVSAAAQWFFLPGEIIVREMDLSPWIYIVHRGSILIKQNDEELAKLTKGSIFGQLDGTKPRPVRITAYADGYADLLQISIKDFQDVVEDETRERMKHNPSMKHDFMPLKNTVPENPYNTLSFILRGRKTIKMPVKLLLLPLNV